jgi:transcriptional regulator with XRE-family HTH domain
MIIGERLRQFRKRAGKTQVEIGRICGFRQATISSIESGQATPALETLEVWANALSVPLYQLFYEGDGLPPVPHFSKSKGRGRSSVMRVTEQLHSYLVRMDRRDRRILIRLALGFAERK